jgi:predicted nucleotidyltransferase
VIPVEKAKDTAHIILARRLAERFRQFPAVDAVALAGSLTSGGGDRASDIDLYVYTPSVIPLAEREALVQEFGASRADMNLMFWDLGDEWFHAGTGIEVDLIYWAPTWIEEQLNRVLVRHQGSTGYSTCFWHTIRSSRVLFDRRGWLAGLKAKAEQPYPEELRRSIISKNHPVLRRVIPAYAHQIEKAVRRGDLVSINHRVAALLSSYFDTLFAINRVLNPGEKRLVAFAQATCPRLPPRMAGQVQAVLEVSGTANPELALRVEALLDGLDQLLVDEGIDPKTT